MDENLPQKYTELATALRDKAVEFDKILRTLTHINSDLKDRCEKAIEVLSKFGKKQELTCSVCCTRARTHLFLPCAHGGFCDACSTRGVRRGRCFTCRGPVDSTLRIFL